MPDFVVGRIVNLSNHFEPLHEAIDGLVRRGVPEQAVNPPEDTVEDQDRDLRNSCRTDILDALGTIEDRMEELECLTPNRKLWIEAIRAEIKSDWEEKDD